MSDESPGVYIPIPLPEKHVFRYQAADDILELLYRNPHEDFRITELRTITGHGGKSVDNAIQILNSLKLVEKSRDGRHTLIQIDRERIRKPDDPILEIPQEEFRDPVKAFTDRIEEDRGDNLVGILVFGSTARGTADRASDIDIQVIVETDLLESRRRIQEIRQQVEDQKFDGERFEFHVLVESMESAESYGEKLRELFSEAVAVYSSPKLEDVRETVFNG